MDNNNQQPPPPTSAAVIPPPGSTPVSPSRGASSYHELLQQQLQMFWNYQRTEIEQVNDFKNHQLPLARIKKIMKADEDVRMISAEAPILFAKACEIFILELTIRSWLHAEENKRRTLQENDIAAAITRTDIFDFLVDIVPREEEEEEEAAAPAPYYYPPMGQPAGTMIGRPVVDHGGVYAQPQSQVWQSVWKSSGGGEDVSYGSGGSGGGHGNIDNQGLLMLKSLHCLALNYFERAWKDFRCCLVLKDQKLRLIFNPALDFACV
ncbi:hypothetical protein F2Q69_00040103 [Brassica cretica]|uniref:Core Histone H2A/H2B/H3 domain-containing protein n=1 Tax=Brassica cretica TaxID=69181 RepID=A0A8S9NDK3_BRACR|nr:hypothetical protein F2Q69_00040103 [Brassica cretica]